MADATKIPLKTEVSKEYAAAREKVSELRARQHADRTESGQIRTRLVAGQGNDGRDARAAAIISGEAADEKENDKARLTFLAHDIADVERALELFSDSVSIESRKAGQLVCDVAEAPYKKSVADICNALIAAHNAHLTFNGIVENLNNDNVAWTGRDGMYPMHPKFLGYVKDKFSYVGCYLREAAKHGFISASQIPSDLRV